MDAVLKKLQYKPPATITVLGAPPELESLVESWKADGTVRRRLGAREDFALVFVRSQTDVEKRAGQFGQRLGDDPVLWFAYPKKSSQRHTSDLAQMVGWQPLGDLGLEAVRQVSLDTDWSALRFRRAADIGRLERQPSMALSDEGKRRVGPGR